MALNSNNFHNPLRQPLKVGLDRPIETTYAESPPLVETAAPIEKVRVTAEKYNELQKAIALLKASGMEVAKPKIKWAKHSFEFKEETLHLFKEMVRELGYDSVKEASEEMMKEWTTKRAHEFNRRKNQY